MIAALELALLVGALPQQLELTFDQAPEGCALDVRLPQSIGHYVPRLSLARTSGEGTWKLAVTSRPFEVEIVLTDDRNTEQLRRVLRSEPEACAATADGIGLILERYLSDLGYETGFTPLPELPPPPPAVTATIARRVDTSTPAAPSDLDVDLELALGGLVDLSPNGARGGGAVDLALAVLFLRFELSGFGLYRGVYDVTRGQAPIGEYRVGSIGGLFRVGGCLELDPFSLCGLAGAGIEQVRASTTGETVFGTADQNDRGALVSAGLRADWAIGRFRLYFRGDTLFRIDRLRVMVAGADDPYRDARIAAFLSLGVAVQIF